uniref:Putative secreted peptide n=1 Tax=Anopheles braziliensis TaxID=58242 RepID=A0A2M3ZTL9_9DIPT
MSFRYFAMAGAPLCFSVPVSTSSTASSISLVFELLTPGAGFVSEETERRGGTGGVPESSSIRYGSITPAGIVSVSAAFPVPIGSSGLCSPAASRSAACSPSESTEM